MGIIIPAATSLESPEAKNQVEWEKESTKDKTGAAYSGKNTFKSGEGEFAVVHQGDNFKASHSYMLLTDVPGASANSGATITAKDSSGNQAFVATETRGTTEQECAVGAGSELKTLLDNAGKSNYVQLATPAKRIQNSGSVTVEWIGSAFSPTIEIKHGLGVEPATIILGVEKIGSIFAYFDYKEVNATRFKVEGIANSTLSAGTKSKLSWIALA